MSLFPVVILAGGKAQRLQPFSLSSPKALVPIHGQAFIDFQLNRLKQQGVNDVLICIGRLGDKIIAHVGDGRKYGLKVSYSDELIENAGTGSAIYYAFDKLPPNFFLLYGDSYLLCDFHKVQKAYQLKNKPAMMTVYKNCNQGVKSNVIFKEGQILTYDKTISSKEMQYIDYGLGVFSKKVFTEKKAKGLDKIYQLLLQDNQLDAFEVKEPFYEVGSFRGIKRLEKSGILL